MLFRSSSHKLHLKDKSIQYTATEYHGNHSIGNVIFVGFAFISGETNDDYLWAMKELKMLMQGEDINDLAVVVTNRELALINALQEDTSTINETCITRVQRRVQKLANAGQKAIAYCALLEHEKQLLKKINSEAKVRRSTKSNVLGKGQGKVMSFENIEVA
ncbi:MAG: hypothetical protein M1840_002408 [Geoglossum simile]|nr:MAG: hypothetical protein M1840_002408 [Geoglossum simile]